MITHELLKRPLTKDEAESLAMYLLDAWFTVGVK